MWEEKKERKKKKKDLIVPLEFSKPVILTQKA